MITISNPVSTYAGNGATTSFPYLFPISDDSYLGVTLTDSFGNVTTLVLDVDYTVNGVGSTNNTLWTITYPIAVGATPMAAGYTLTISPTLPFIQETNYENQGGFFPDTVEESLDYLTLLCQQLNIQLSGVTVSPGLAAAAEASATAAAASAAAAATSAAAIGSVTTDPFDQAQYAVAAGTNNYTATLPVAPTSYQVGMECMLLMTNGNTGACTVNLNGLGVIPILHAGTALTSGSIRSGQVSHLTYDGTQFNLINPGSIPVPSQPADTFTANLTGATASPVAVTPIQASNALDLPPVAVASASTTVIGGAGSDYVFITGATTITAFDTVASGIIRTVVFQGSLILTYNAATLILPGAANITTAVGDVAMFVSEGSGIWRCLNYIPASGLPISSMTDTGANMAVFSASGSWTIPAGITSVKATLIGGGGGGGGSSTGGGQCGGGGAGVIAYLTGLSPGTAIAFTVGLGGNGSPTAGGSNGGATSLTGRAVTANGGAGGGTGSNPAGLGGTATGGTIQASGSSPPTTSSSFCQAGFGGFNFGNPGVKPTTGNGTNASGYGAGGGGGSGSGFGGAGGNGAGGCVIFEW